jgi:hypothetical protein
MRSLTFPLLIGVLFMVACTERPPPMATPAKIPFKSVATAKQLMNAIVVPTSQVVLAAAHQAPTSEEGWVNAERNAIALAESGNLLMIPGRMPKTQMPSESEWTQQSVALTEAATLAVTAAGEKDPSRLKEAGEAVYAVCESCHQRFKRRP